jgi:hypothetical protein
MGCQSCNDTYQTVLGFSQISGNSNCACTDCEPVNVQKTSCVYYGGPNLNCLGVETCDDLDVVLSKIDEKVCAVTGDYSLYNKFCLDDVTAITNEQQFVEAISEQFCSLKTNTETFLNTSFPDYQTVVDNRFDTIETPGITCTIASVVNTDSLNTILTKYCTLLSQIQSNLDVSGVDWDQCFVVSGVPSTLSQAFDLVIDQICAVKSSMGASVVLPVFNNIGSCLPAPLTATDTLESTVNKIKTKLCTLPTFDNTLVTWGCVASSVSLQGTVQNIISKLSFLSQNSVVSVTSDFTLIPVNSSDLCQGYQLALASGIVDRKFSLNSGDTSSGFFLDKVQAGTNVNFDTISVPGKVVINSPAGADEKVKAFTGDPTNGYLIDKLEGAVDIAAGLTINISTNSTTNKVRIVPTLDLATFITSQLQFIQSNDTLRAVFCNLVSSCTTTPPDPGTPDGIFYISSTLSGVQITAVAPTGAYAITTGALPISAGQSASGNVIGTTLPISVTITGTPVIPGNLTLYKNGVAQQQISITGAGVFSFLAVTFANTDNMTISLSTGALT